MRFLINMQENEFAIKVRQRKKTAGVLVLKVLTNNTQIHLQYTSENRTVERFVSFAKID